MVSGEFKRWLALLAFQSRALNSLVLPVAFSETPSRKSSSDAQSRSLTRPASTEFPYNGSVRTVIETPTFQKQAEKLWSEDERLAFIDWIAVNPLAGDVIPGADGARKVRWSRAGSGKSSGARVIYFNLTEQEVVLLIAAYPKANRDNMLPADIKKAV